MNMRVLSQVVATLLNRSRFSNQDTKTFEGRRDIYDALGYPINITEAMYRSRYRRNAVAGRIVDAKPEDTWRGGAELVENPDVDTDTPFEEAFEALNDRLNVWNTLRRADTLAGIGHYSIILLGLPGELGQPVEHAGPEDLAYITPYAEDDAPVKEIEIDEKSPRFGLPLIYEIKRTSVQSKTSINSAIIGKKVHWTRVIHVADGMIDDPIYGTPRLERVWNLLDDLMKVTGGGAEAFWKRADQGLQIDIDPTLDITPEGEAALEDEVQEYVHGLKRILKTRGVKMNPLGSDVANFQPSAEAILEQISAGTGIPQRVLMGSEQGKLAADQDSTKYYEMIETRRADFAAPQIVRPFVDRLIELGVLPKPKLPYVVDWSQVRTMDDEEKSLLAKNMADVNRTQGETVITSDEIREKALGWDPLSDDQKAEIEAKKPAPAPVPAPRELREPKVAAEKAPNKIRLVERDRRGLIARIVEKEEAC